MEIRRGRSGRSGKSERVKEWKRHATANVRSSRRMAERMEMSIFIGRVCKRQPIPIQNALKMEMGKRPGEKEER